MDKAVDVDNQLRDGEYQVYESFVKEKNVILNYVFDLVLFAAKIQDIPESEIFLAPAYQKRI
jgi:tubulin-specific chaperone D